MKQQSVSIPTFVCALVFSGVFGVCVMAVPGTAASFTVDPEHAELPLHLEADKLEYDAETGSLFGSGSVLCEQGPLSIRADTFYLSVEKNIMEAYGKVVLKDGETSVFGELLFFDWNTKKGTISPAVGSEGYWKFFSEKVDRIDDQRLVSHNARFTTCDRNPAHYYVHSKKATIKLKKSVVFKHAFIMIDEVPVFYLPVYYRSLKERKVSIRVKPGYNKTDGIILLTEIGYPTSEHTYLTGLIDYYEERGTGKGMQFDYYTEELKGSIYGYTINERDSDHTL